MNVLNVVPLRSPRIVLAPMEAAHVSVLEKEVVAALQPRAGGVYVDATLGAGGHTLAILATPGTKVIGLDRDPAALDLAEERLSRFGGRVVYRHARFGDLDEVLEDVGVDRVDGVLADLGVSSMQLDQARYGMSFRREGALDMRMDPDDDTTETALELIERLDDDELTEIIATLGDERRARRVARCIKQAADQGSLRTTLDLRRAVVRAVGPSRVGGVDPATRTFQALRMAVNGELGELSSLLGAAEACLADDGRLAVISFHSLEDRMVKRALRDRALWEPIGKSPITVSGDELERNPRSRSAKLRAARRLPREVGSA